MKLLSRPWLVLSTGERFNALEGSETHVAHDTQELLHISM